MKKWMLYTALQLKRGWRYLPKMMMFTLVLVLAAGVFCGVMMVEKEIEQQNAMFKVGITGDIDNSYIQLAILAVRQFDSSGKYVKFVTMEEDRAEEALKSGELFGYLIVPEGFIDKVFRGEDFSLTYIAGSSPVGLGALLTNEVVTVVSDMISEAIAGILAVQYVAGDYDLTEDMTTLGENINIHYAAYILDREELYKVSYIGIENGMSFGGAFVAGMMVVLILLMGITCAPMMIRTHSARVRLAKTRGIGVYRQIYSEFLGFVFPIIAVTAVIVIGASGILAYRSLPIPELKNVSGTTILSLIPVILLLAAMEMLIFECCSDMISGVTLQFMVAIGLAYISGCFYPSYFFPEIVRTLAAYLPVGVTLDYIGGMFNGDRNAVVVLGYAAVLLILTGVVRTLRMRGSER